MALQGFLETVLAFLNHFPLFAIMLWFKDPERLPGGLRFDVFDPETIHNRRMSITFPKIFRRRTSTKAGGDSSKDAAAAGKGKDRDIATARATAVFLKASQSGEIRQRTAPAPTTGSDFIARHRDYLEKQTFQTAYMSLTVCFESV